MSRYQINDGDTGISVRTGLNTFLIQTYDFMDLNDANTLNGQIGSYYLDYNNLTNTPILFSGSFLDLTNKPTTIAGYGITDAFDGQYSSLTGVPTIPSDLVDLTDNTNLLFSKNYNDLLNLPTDVTDLSLHFTTELAEGTNLYYTESRVSANTDVAANTTYRNIDHIPLTEKAANNGVATLDAGGKIPASQLPTTIMNFKGNWDTSTNTPTLIDGTGNAGDVYLVNVAGTQDLGSGSLTFMEGDWVVYNGTIWEKSINSNSVVSVNGQTGIVSLNADNIDDTNTINKFVTSEDLTKLSNLSGVNTGDITTMDSSSISFTLVGQNLTADIIETGINHDNIQNIGVNTHAQIDTHISDTSIHFTETSIDHTAITNIGINTHDQIDAHISNTINPHNVIASQVNVSDPNNYYTNTNVENILDEIGETRDINGYDKYKPESEPDLSFDNSTRTFSVSVKNGSPNYYFWANSHKVIKTTTESVVIPDITGVYYIYFDNNGILQYINETNIILPDFYINVITGVVYWNATNQFSMPGDAMHGKLMDAITHQYNHVTFGARYETGNNGLDITGLVSNSTTYSSHTSGYFWNEDIRYTVSTQTIAPFLYKNGANGEWAQTTPDNKVSYNNGGSYDVWNNFNGTSWELVEGTTNTDFWIIFTIAMPDFNGYAIKKIIGQNAYSSRNKARNALYNEIGKIILSGLPTNDFIFLQAWIVKRDGTLQTDSEGNTHIDLRTYKGAIGENSSTSNLAENSITNTTNFNGILSSLDSTVQNALDTIDNNFNQSLLTTDTVIFDTLGISCTPTEKLEVLGNIKVSGNMLKMVGITTTVRDGLTAQAGDIIYNTAVNKHQAYNGTSWFDLY